MVVQQNLCAKLVVEGTGILIAHYLFQVQDTRIDQRVHGGLDEKMHQQPHMEGCPPGRCSPALEQKLMLRAFTCCSTSVKYFTSHVWEQYHKQKKSKIQFLTWYRVKSIVTFISKKSYNLWLRSLKYRQENYFTMLHSTILPILQEMNVQNLFETRQ